MRGPVTAVALVTLLAGCGCGELLVPRERFDEVTPPAAPDYAHDAAWAALPSKDDGADVAVEGESDGQAEAAAGVFFVHPTTYYSPRTWNQPLDDERANDLTDRAVLRNQASVFNGSARVFAPRYRQATLGVYTTARTDEADQALALAYGDVSAAFDAFLERSAGRPIIIGAHSQGADHALRLISERFSDLAADPSLRERLVAAYVIGRPVPSDVLERVTPGVPLCASATQTGCWITYNSVAAGSAPARFDSVRLWDPEGPRTVNDPAILCVNPVTWSLDGAWSTTEQHLGAAMFEDQTAPVFRAALTARCNDRGLLEVDVTGGYDPGADDDYHRHDYGLFYLDLRANIAARVEAFLAR